MSHCQARGVNCTVNTTLILHSTRTNILLKRCNVPGQYDKLFFDMRYVNCLNTDTFIVKMRTCVLLMFHSGSVP